jgi:hypothetical protein
LTTEFKGRLSAHPAAPAAGTELLYILTTDNKLYKRNSTEIVGYVEANSSGLVNDTPVIMFPTEYNNGDSGTAKTITLQNGQNQKINITANTTLTVTPPTLSGTGVFKVKITYPNSTVRTITWSPSTIKWFDGDEPTLSFDTTIVDILAFYWDGTVLYGQLSAFSQSS